MQHTDVFIQVKIDYVQYMMQIYKLMAYEETQTGILFALMMDNYLTAYDLEVLTGFSKTTITKALSRISIMLDEFPILQTKKPHDRKKYYYCPISLEAYVKHNFLAVTTMSELSLDFIPGLISRLNALTPQTSSNSHIRRTLLYLYTAVYYYKEVIEKSEVLLDKMFNTPKSTPDFGTLLRKVKSPSIPEGLVPKEDTLLDIKRDFIKYMIRMSTELIGGNEELISVFLALFLESEPVTQDDLIEVTKESRTKVSQALSMMEELKVVQVIKKSGHRKKFYQGASNLETYGIGKLGRVQGYYAQIQMMMQKKFLPDLDQISVSDEKEKKEKERLKKFFEDNVFYYDIFIRFSTVMHEALGAKLKEVMNSIS
ncbi:MAG: hypothetical protein JSV04_11190 [Candidatus Heimdallarchaeota archaeon]|nr:MAG: hypothetical protein JSV04_11190 [Candidatus Heimdallarchaeota archaeon]